MARLGKSIHPPVARLGKHPINTKATTPQQANRESFEPALCGACVQCISGLLLGRHQYNRSSYHPLPFDVSPL